MFFGTPHSGSEVADLGYMFTKVAKILLSPVIRINCTTLGTLRKENNYLEHVNESFRQYALRPGPPVCVVSVYESRVRWPLRSPVSESDEWSSWLN
jgi:hypothetical protein